MLELLTALLKVNEQSVNVPFPEIEIDTAPPYKSITDTAVRSLTFQIFSAIIQMLHTTYNLQQIHHDNSNSTHKETPPSD